MPENALMVRRRNLHQSDLPDTEETLARPVGRDALPELEPSRSLAAKQTNAGAKGA